MTGTRPRKSGHGVRRLLVALFSTAAIGIWAVQSSGQDQPLVGFVLMESASGAAPQGTALFSFRNPQGILIWKASVEAVEPDDSGRILVDSLEGGLSALALANVSDQPADLRLLLRDSGGLEVNRQQRILGPHEHRALYVDEMFSIPAEFQGSLSFQEQNSEKIVAAVTLRQNRNHYQEPIFSTLPVARVQESPAPAAEESPAVIIPHLGAGQGLSTELVLLNLSDQPERGRLELFSSSGDPLLVDMEGGAASSLQWELPPNGVYRTELVSDDEIKTGYGVVTLEEGDSLPTVSGLFRFRRQQSVLTETGVLPAEPGRHFRLVVDQQDTRTGLALASPGNETQQVRYRLLDQHSQLIAQTSAELLGGGHISLFVDELFPHIPADFTGILEIEAEQPVAAISLELTFNSRGDPVLTTLPVIDLDRPLAGTVKVFPQFGFGSGFSTRLIVLNGEAEGTVRFSFFETATSNPLELPLGEAFGSSFEFNFDGGDLRQFRPGDATPVSGILLDSFEPGLNEIVVHLDQEFQLRPRVIDAHGNPRDDFAVAFESLDDEVLTVDPEGRVKPVAKGFATVRITAGGLTASGWVGVVKVSRNLQIESATGVVQDLAGRVYAADTTRHVILRADSFAAEPEIFAGNPGQAGFQDGMREQALFRSPTYLELDQSSGDLFVSDTGNHVIRVVHREGTVETLAGTGEPGYREGPASEAEFQAPQGLALDPKGRLWVADSGNHVVRRVELAERRTALVAGAPGTPGSRDGLGSQALFDGPIGVAVVNGTLTESLAPLEEREVEVVVADSGNNRIRRVNEAGRVETIRRRGVETSGAMEQPLQVSRPRGLDVDTGGNILVMSEDLGPRLLRSGNGIVVPLANSTVAGNSGILTPSSGRAVLGGADGISLVELGGPQLTEVFPDQLGLSGGDMVTLRGRNFTPDSAVLLGGVLVTAVDVRSSRELRFRTPSLEIISLQNLTVLSRGGAAQRSVSVNPVPFEDLEPGEITTIAGGAIFDGDGGPALTASLRDPQALAFDSAGNLYLADTENSQVRRIDAATQIITTIAGNGQFGFGGDGGPATAALLGFPQGITFDSVGNLYIADSGSFVVRKVDPTGRISTVAGNGCSVYDGEDCELGDGGPALEASLELPTNVAIGPEGHLYIADPVNVRPTGFESHIGNRVRKVNLATMTISTVAGNGCTELNPGENCSIRGEGEPATEVSVFDPKALAFDPEGNLLIGDTDKFPRVRRIDSESGRIETVAGAGFCCWVGENVPPTDVSVQAAAMQFDDQGNLIIMESTFEVVRKVDAESGLISTIAGVPCNRFAGDCTTGDGGPASEATFVEVRGMALDGSGAIFLSDHRNNRIDGRTGVIRRIDPVTGIIDRVAGNTCDISLDECGGGDGSPATAVSLYYPHAAAFDSLGDLFIAGNSLIRKLDHATGTIQTVVARICPNGESVCSSDSVGIRDPENILFLGSLAFHPDSSLFFSVREGIWRLDPEAHTLKQVLEPGESGLQADIGTIDPAGNLFLIGSTDQGANSILRMDAAEGTVTRIAGSDCQPAQECETGDGGSALEASFRASALTLDPVDSKLYLSDTAHRSIRALDLESGIITTIAGSGICCERKEGPALETDLYPQGLSIGPNGTLFVADGSGLRIWEVDISAGQARIVAGNGEAGLTGDGKSALDASLNDPLDVTVDGEGNLFIVSVDADFTGRVRVVKGPFP